MYSQTNAPPNRKGHIEREITGVLCGRYVKIEWARYSIDGDLHKYLMRLQGGMVGTRYVCLDCLRAYQQAHLPAEASDE